MDMWVLLGVEMWKGSGFFDRSFRLWEMFMALHFLNALSIIECFYIALFLMIQALLIKVLGVMGNV